MMQVNTPVENFFDTDGTALDDGYIYIGESGLNPETHPQAVYWDKDGLIPAAQPIRTRNGYPYRDGAASKFYTEEAYYSITVRNKTGVLVFSSLNTDSGLFLELSTPQGAALIGYDNTVSGLTADTLQEAVDELEEEIDDLSDRVDDIVTAGVFNLFGNSAFNINSRGYVSGTATTSANEFTLDLLSVVVSGESLSWVAGDFGNRITAPVGGVRQIIEAGLITGGTYACTWLGSGTIEVNGEPRAKNASFDIDEETAVTIHMVGEFEQFMFTRPAMIGRFEYDGVRDYALCQPHFDRWQNTYSTASGTSVVSPVMPPWAADLVIGVKDLSTNGSASVTIQFEYSGGWVVAGYLGHGYGIDGSGVYTSYGLSTGFRSPGGEAISAVRQGSFVAHLIHPAAHVWSGQLNFGRSDVTALEASNGTVTLPGKLTRVRITTQNGTDTFDSGTVSFSWRA